MKLGTINIQNKFEGNLNGSFLIVVKFFQRFLVTFLLVNRSHLILFMLICFLFYTTIDIQIIFLFLCIFRRELGIEADERDDSSESTTTNGMPEVEEAVDAPPVEKLIQDSGKMVFLAHLMQKLKDGKHRTIIFSQSRKMLDIIQKTLLSTVRSTFLEDLT